MIMIASWVELVACAYKKSNRFVSRKRLRNETNCGSNKIYAAVYKNIAIPNDMQNIVLLSILAI